MRLRGQLMCVALSGVASAALVAGIGAWTGQRVENAYSLAVREMKAVRAQMEGDMMHDAIHADILHWKTAASPDEGRKSQEDFAEHAERMRRCYAEVEELSSLEGSAATIREAQGFVESYIASAERVLNGVQSEQRSAEFSEFLDRFEEGEDVLGAASDLLQSGAESTAARATETSQQARVSSLGLAGAMIILVSGVSAWMSSRIAHRTRRALTAVIQLGEGNLTHRVVDTGTDEIGDFARGYNVASDRLKELITQVREAAGIVSASSTEIAAAIEEMAAGIARQRDQASQVAAAMEEMAGSVSEVATRARSAADTSHSAQSEAERGGEVVARTVVEMNAIADDVGRSSQAMGGLGQRSEQIGAIIEVINNIADQTNLLALNAAIEAARAGAHGRGFAVVADEVRKLAERTQQATEQVATSIREIQGETKGAVERIEAGAVRVTRGVGLANSAGEALTTIVGSGKKVQALVESIASASTQQASAGDQITRNITQILAVSEENNQGAEQAARGASELAAQAGRLRELVNKFSV